ncbi:flippase [Halobellus ruber]|uniref:Flippase n=1 Tax=Halobellus ruber TaxID=2761102 RepID=A0A7J9SKG8_9EURY|nr:flippase [Halobellus ruber]MBB6646609.1 flippase [Halobellus ruber]
MDLAKSITKLFGAKLLSSIISFVGLAFFARELGASELGTFFLFQAAVGILKLPANFGINGALEKRISGSNQPGIFLSTAIFLKFLPLTLISIAIFAFREVINEYVGTTVGVSLIAGLIAAEAYQMVMHLLRGELDVSRSADLVLLRRMLWIAFGVTSISILNYKANGLIYAWILATVCAFISGIYLKSTSTGYPSWSKARSLFSFAKFDVISGAGSVLFNWLDVLIIGLVLSQAEVGAYETAWRLASVTILLGIAVRNSMFPQVSVWHNEGNWDKISSTVSNMITASLFFVIPSFVGVAILSEELLGLIFGEEFVLASTALSILVAQKMFQAINQVIGRTLQATGSADLAAYAMIGGALVNIMLNIILVPTYGLEGAALATFFSYLCMTTIRVHFFKRYISMSPDWTGLGWLTLSSAAMGLAVWVATLVVVPNSLFKLATVVSVGVTVYFVVVLASERMRARAVKQIMDI